MMSPLLDSMESTWRDQLRSMREAIAELKLDSRGGEVPMYGQEMLTDDATQGSGSESIWDVWSDDEETQGSSDVDVGVIEQKVVPNGDKLDYGRAWLRSRCAFLAKGKTGFNADQLEEQMSVLIGSDMLGNTALVKLGSCLTD